jgi:MutS domain V
MRASSAPVQANTVLTDYKSRVQYLQILIAASRSRKKLALGTSLACAATFVVALIIALKGAGFLFAPMPILLIVAIWQFQTSSRYNAKLTGAARRSAFYERGIDRIEDNWRGKGSTGLEFAREHHLYQSDLDILGEGSLFELISTTRSEVGAERLASFLLDPPIVHEAQARQDAVKELRDAAGLREEVAVLGKYQFQNCREEHLREWLNRPVLRVPRMIPIFLPFSSTACMLLGLCGYAKMFPWLQIASVLAPLLIAQAGIGLALMRRVRIHIKTLLALVGDVVVLRQGIELVDRQEFHSAKLRDLIECLRQGNAAVTIRKLERRLIAIERKEDVVLYGFSLWLAAGTQLVLSIERWRARHQSDFEDWLDAWAEFEAVNALACYSWEHPDFVFPELLEGDATFEAKSLGHTLLSRDHCVGNEVALNGSTAFYIVSGSNMAGKSTFLRAVGLNAVLASAGAPVRASSARTAVFRICASIAINDSLQEGKSKFLAEVERLRESIRATKERGPVMFLIDEILSGTNSRDRRIAAEALIGALVVGGAVGALSTHDLALTEIAEKSDLRGINIHMGSDNPEEPLAFDYRVKPGISRQANALAIVRLMGISV